MNNPVIEISGRKIGRDFDPLVVAEIGINHGGSLETAKEMVDSAVRAGAEVIKHQTHVVEDEMSAAAKAVVPGNASTSIYDIMAKCALDEADEFELKRYVESKGAIFLSTPFSRAAANRLHRFGLPAFKIGSGECNNYPLLDHIAAFGKPIILSTGMNTIDSVAKAVNILRRHKVQFALLHTTNLYPTPYHLVRLGAMSQLAEAFPDAPVGLSDHTLDNLACLGAVALGASLLERHFTDTMRRSGPDIPCSMDEGACKELILQSKAMKAMRGGMKGPAQEEQVTIDFAFASVVAIQDIAQGEILSKENTWVKRPGTGPIRAADWYTVLGKMAARNIKADEFIDWSNLADA